MISLIKYVKGDATNPLGSGKKLLPHIVNDQGGWGAGYVLALSKKWKEPETEYRKWSRNGTDFILGNIQVVQTKQPDIVVVNMLAQKGFGGVAVKYDKLRECLTKVAIEAQKDNASVHMPRIGCGLGGGAWFKIEPIISETLLDKGIAVTIYDF